MKEALMAERDGIATPRGPIVIRQAEPADLDAVVAIWEEANAWLRSRGIEPGEPPRPLREIFADRIHSGSVYLALLNGQPAGTLMLQWEDDASWPGAHDDAVTLHGFAVARAAAGIGRDLLRWVERQTPTRGRQYIRLECSRDNPVLRAYYERAGFVYIGDAARTHDPLARYEKFVGDVSSRP
jgi:ribosomal protein S18 acetylase RimI-like enzyme